MPIIFGNAHGRCFNLLTIKFL